MGIIRWFIIAGAFNGFLLAGLLLQQNRLRNSNLSLFIIGFSYFIIVPEIIRSYAELFPHIIATPFPLLFTFGPLIFFYGLSLNNKTVSNRSKLFHFIPSVGILIYFLPFFIQSGDQKLTFLSKTIEYGVPLNFKLVWVLAGFHILFYLRKLQREVASLSSMLRSNFSNLDKLNFEWLQLFTSCYFILWILHVLSGILWIFEIEVNPLGINDQLLGAFGAITIYFIGYNAISRPEFMTGILEGSPRQTIVGKEEQTEILSKLESIMELDQPYLDPDLSLHQLAKMINASPRKLSEVINVCRGENFYDFINEYRVEESKRLLSDPKYNHYTILAMGYEAGFRSKSTFNKFFKQKEGVSPSFYKKSMLKKINS